MRPPTHALRWTQNPRARDPVVFVSFLGSVISKDGSGPVSKSVPVASLTILPGESIFVGMTQTVGDGVGWGATDNLGNTYTVETGPYTQTTPVIFGQVASGLLACLHPTPGVLTSINVTWTNPLIQDSALAIRAVRLRNVGARLTSAVEVKQWPNYNSDNFILTDLGGGPPGSCAVAVYSSRTAGTDGADFYYPSLYLGVNNTTGGSDSSNALVGMGAAVPLTAAGIGINGIHHDGSRAIIHCGKAYEPA